jgi:hypothetical protein
LETEDDADEILFLGADSAEGEALRFANLTFS